MIGVFRDLDRLAFLFLDLVRPLMAHIHEKSTVNCRRDGRGVLRVDVNIAAYKIRGVCSEYGPSHRISQDGFVCAALFVVAGRA